MIPLEPGHEGRRTRPQCDQYASCTHRTPSTMQPKAWRAPKVWAVTFGGTFTDRSPVD